VFTGSLDTDQPAADLIAGSPGIDLPAAVCAAEALLSALGVRDRTEIAVRTPARMAAGLAELLSCAPWEFTVFPNAAGHHELVLVRDVPFTSLCAHHLLLFSGLAHIGLLPGDKIAGLSKLARAVEACAASLKVQEEFGQQIAGFLEEHLDPRGVGVILAAEHLCMTRRGVRAAGAYVVTIATRGQLREDPGARNEFIQLNLGVRGGRR